MTWIVSIVFRILRYFGMKKELTSELPLSPEAAQMRVLFVKAILSGERNQVSYSDKNKSEMIRNLILRIPSMLEDAVKSDNKEFTICYAHLEGVGMRSNSKERVFKELFPKVVEELRALSIPFRMGGAELLYFDVPVLKKLTNYEKMHALL